jgi:hypothetical protein
MSPPSPPDVQGIALIIDAIRAAIEVLLRIRHRAREAKSHSRAALSNLRRLETHYVEVLNPSPASQPKSAKAACRKKRSSRSGR